MKGLKVFLIVTGLIVILATAGGIAVLVLGK